MLCLATAVYLLERSGAISIRLARAYFGGGLRIFLDYHKSLKVCVLKQRRSYPTARSSLAVGGGDPPGFWSGARWSVGAGVSCKLTPSIAMSRRRAISSGTCLESTAGGPDCSYHGTRDFKATWWPGTVVFQGLHSPAAFSARGGAELSPRAIPNLLF